MKKIILLLLLFSFFSCGFHPIYKADNKISESNQSYSQELAAIQIKPERKRLNQELRNNLETVLNPDNIKTDPKYLLTITLTKNLVSTFITSTGASGRNQVTLIANYQLKDLSSGEIIASGVVSARDDFDVDTTKRFANYITEDSIASNLTLQIAQNLRNLLINDIVDDFKKAKERQIMEKLPKNNQEDE